MAVRPSYFAAERRVLAHGERSNGEAPISGRDAQRLVDSGRYRRSTGAPYGALHYRRSLPDGSCLHLVIETSRRRLHHDTFDPHAGPLSLLLHAAHEARTEAVSSAVLAWSVLRLLAR
jgi:hypothetical protein